MDNSRDSLDHRFGDDLFEIIVSYLPIKDKFRLECISKRFQAFLFSKQRILILDNSHRDTPDRLYIGDIISNSQVNTDKLRKLLKKCYKVIDITVDTKYMTIAAKNAIINTIANHCDRLYAIRFDLQFVDKRILNKFIDKYKNNLRRVGLFSELFADSPEMHNRLIKVCPNLMYISDLSITTLSQRRMATKKLLKIDKLVITDEYYDHLVLLSDDRYKRLEHLSIEMNIVSKTDSFLVENISKLEALIHLEISGHTRNCAPSFWPNAFRSVSVGCKNLTSFAFMSLNRNNTFNLNELLDSFSNFSSLKKFTLIADYLRPSHSKSIGSTNLQFLTNCKDLQSLDIRFAEVGDYVLEDIDKYAPRLKYVVINGNFTISDYAFEQLAKLKDLSVVKIVGRCRLDISADDLHTLISSCCRFKSFITGSCVTYTKMRELLKIKVMAMRYKSIYFKVGSKNECYQRF